MSTKHEQIAIRPYMTTNEACNFLGVSRATFYRLYYVELINDPATRIRHGHPMYEQDRVAALLEQPNSTDTIVRRLRASKVAHKKQSSQRRQKRLGAEQGIQPSFL